MSSGTSWGMPSEGPQEPKPTRRDLYEMADSIAVDLAVEEPDWYSVARGVAALARFLRECCETHTERMTGLAGTPASPDLELSHLYRLAEDIVEGITRPAPDWCDIAPDARELAD